MDTDPFVLGKYRLLVEIARGGMGIVYLAAAQGPGGFSKLLIVKELKRQFAGNAAFLTMFLEEARLAARLDHPNIVRTIEVGDDGDRHYIAMEYLQGQPLSRIRKRAPSGFDVRAELRVMSDVLRGLHHAHTLKDFDGSAAHVIHRDVSPQNVFVTYDGQAKIVDFGIAKAADTENHTQAGMFKGKAGYIAPEQVTGRTLDPRTDVFAAGVVLWEAVAGRRMWTYRHDIEILKRLLGNDIPRIRDAAPGVDDDLARIVEKATAWKVDDRQPSAEALALEIDAYLADHGGAPTLREIGSAIEDAFQTEREELRQVLEPQLAALKRRTRPSDVPSLSRLAIADGPVTSPSASTATPIATVTSAELSSVQTPTQPPATRQRATSRQWFALAAACAPILIAAAAFTSPGAGADPTAVSVAEAHPARVAARANPAPLHEENALLPAGAATERDASAACAPNQAAPPVDSMLMGDDDAELPIETP